MSLGVQNNEVVSVGESSVELPSLRINLSYGDPSQRLEIYRLSSRDKVPQISSRTPPGLYGDEDGLGVTLRERRSTRVGKHITRVRGRFTQKSSYETYRLTYEVGTTDCLWGLRFVRSTLGSRRGKSRGRGGCKGYEDFRPSQQVWRRETQGLY